MMASMMAAVVSAVVETRIMPGTIVNTSGVEIIPVPGITIPAAVVARPVKPRDAAKTDTEVLGFGVGGDESKQP
jgi:hypothetical protein